MDFIFITCMLSILCAMVGALFGALFVEPFEEKGLNRIRKQFFMAAIFAALWFGVPTYIWGTDMFTSRWDAPFAIAVIAATPFAIAVTALLSWLTMAGRVHAFLEMVPQVAPVGLRNFKLLDVDEDGVISAGDLGHAKQQIGPFSEADLKVIEFIQNRIDIIGHGVGSYTTYNAATKTSSSTSVCVISPRDLEAFEAKMNEKYAAWRQ